MKRKWPSIMIYFTGFLLFPTAAIAVDKGNSEYMHTIFKLDDSANRDFSSIVGEEVRKNDHTARVLFDNEQKNLFIIHHKSLGIRDLKAIVANHFDAPVKVVAQHNYRLIKNAFHNVPASNNRSCGATKAAWKRLYQKYFH